MPSQAAAPEVRARGTAGLECCAVHGGSGPIECRAAATRQGSIGRLWGDTSKLGFGGQNGGIYCKYIYIHIYIYIHTYLHTDLHTYILTYILTYIHTYIYIYIYIHIYIYCMYHISYLYIYIIYILYYIIYIISILIIYIYVYNLCTHYVCICCIYA